jgi:polar amino acid transport system permease protein
MRYHFDFAWLAEYYPLLIKGVGITIELTLIGAVLGVALAVGCAWARALGPKWLSVVVIPYVELIRNTPFIIQLFFIFFGLPGLGIHLNEVAAANIAMVINLGAYGCEIIRAGIEATPRGQFEAGASLAMTPSVTSFSCPRCSASGRRSPRRSSSSCWARPSSRRSRSRT